MIKNSSRKLQMLEQLRTISTYLSKLLMQFAIYKYHHHRNKIKQNYRKERKIKQNKTKKLIANLKLTQP